MNVDDATWAEWQGPLQQALDHAGGTHSLDEIRETIEAGEAQLWVGKHSVAVTEVYDYPRYRVLHIWLAAGDMDEIVRGDAQMTTFAKVIGARSVRVLGRPGWQRALRGNGYEVRGVQLERVLS